MWVLLEGGWGISPSKTHMLVFIVLGKLKRLEVRAVLDYMWVARATKPAPLPILIFNRLNP